MCSRSAEATPRPWWASWTRKATSASSAGAEAGLPSVVDAVVADGGDELAADGGREAHPVHVVVVGEAVDVLGGQPGVGREEAVVLRLVGDLLVEADQPLGVVGGDGPDARGAAVAQHHVGFPVGGVRVPVRRGLHGASVRLRGRDGRREAVCVSARVGQAGRAGRQSGPQVGPTPGSHVGDWSRQP